MRPPTVPSGNFLLGRVIGIALGAISLAILARQGFHFSLGPFVQGVLDRLEETYRMVFGMIEPLIRAQLIALRDLTGWDFQLYPHWKHATSLMLLYFAAFFRKAWNASGPWVFTIVWGGVIALVAGVLSGTVPLEGAASNMLMAFWPIAGVLVFDIGVLTWARLRRRTSSSVFSKAIVATLTRFAPLLAILLLGTQAEKIPFLQSIPSIGLALLLILIVVLGIYNVARGVNSMFEHQRARERMPPEQRAFFRTPTFLQNYDTLLGLDMVLTVVAAALIVLIGMAGA
jgi:hypothetical protein